MKHADVLVRGPGILSEVIYPAADGTPPALLTFLGGVHWAAAVTRTIVGKTCRVLCCDDNQGIPPESIPCCQYELGRFASETDSRKLETFRLNRFWPRIQRLRWDGTFGTAPSAIVGTPGPDNPLVKVLMDYISDGPVKTRVRSERPASTGMTSPLPALYLRIGGNLGDLIQLNKNRRDQGDVVWICNVHDLATDDRVRLDSSYEAITVDVLRSLSRRFLQMGYGTGDAKGTHARNLHLLIRLGLSALLYVQPPRADDKDGQDWKVRIFFSKDRAAPIERPGLGRMIGYRSIIAAMIVKKYAKRPGDGLETIIQSATDDALLWCRQFFKIGFNPGLKDAGVTGGLNRWLKSVNQEYQANKSNLRRTSETWSLEVPFEKAVAPDQYWSILQQSILKKLPAHYPECPTFESNSPGDKATRARDGTTWVPGLYLRKAFELLTTNATLDQLPLVTIGKLKLIDRDEIKEFLAIQNLLIRYGTEGGKKPLCIGVFGPPGSGKSFAIEQVVEELTKSRLKFHPDCLTYNVAQFDGTASLVSALHQVRNVGLKGDIPVVFFDEFDARHGSQSSAWLSQFLAPMQDGTFTSNGMTFNLGRCVLVFAGGINRTFGELDSRQRNAEFCEAKGPDFISRLRGYLNLRGINRPEDEPDPNRYLIRRAVVLRSFLEDLRENEPGQKPVAPMERSLARAFLGVEHFKHGVRSMQALLGMSRPRRGFPLSASDMPTYEQMDMHVDGRQFINKQRMST